MPQCHRSPSVTGYKAENSFSVRCPTRGDARGFRDSNPVLSGFLYSFDAKEVSKIMKMNDFRIQFGADFYIALVRKKDPNRPRFSSKTLLFSMTFYIALVRNRGPKL